MNRARNIRERVMDLEDRLKNGLKRDPATGHYVAVWTAREIRRMRRQAAALAAKVHGKED